MGELLYIHPTHLGIYTRVTPLLPPSSGSSMRLMDVSLAWWEGTMRLMDASLAWWEGSTRLMDASLAWWEGSTRLVVSLLTMVGR